MSSTLEVIRSLVAVNKVRISDHAYDELAHDGLLASDVIGGVDAAVAVEDYPTYAKGPCVLVLQRIAGMPIHALWGVPAGATEPAVLITVYRPDPARWDATFMRRL
jgi:hypothetical protein